ncbi:hypothetical protein [Aminobacter sp. HY435]|uniref:hypothetical protein n=1 Tax=Aminobacter sp. HY435 TaxID=2970917 RepID=UPI0022B985E3|nr:hypothetical protein [Aminobacter sp. HY435]
MTTVEFRIPISATTGMFSMVRLAAMSLARLGPPFSSARIIVSVGDGADYETVLRQVPWSHDYPLEWRIADHESVRVNPLIASGNDRYEESPRADVVVMCDADTCVVNRFDNLLAALVSAPPSVAGLQAHFQPWPKPIAAINDALWNSLLARIGVVGEWKDLGYSLASDGSRGRCPAYFNYGFVAFNRLAFQRIAPLAAKYSEIAREFLISEYPEGIGFQAQIGLSLAIAASGTNVIQLGHAYNCANDDLVLANGLGDLDEVKVIHYLRTQEFDRNRFLCDRQSFQSFTAVPLKNPISEKLRRHVVGLANAFYPNVGG